jgi:hypothetical protein
MTVVRTPLDLDDLVEHWTLLKDEQGLVSGKRGARRLGFTAHPGVSRDPGGRTTAASAWLPGPGK